MNSKSNELDITYHAIMHYAVKCDVVSRMQAACGPRELWCEYGLVGHGHILSCKKKNNVYTNVVVYALNRIQILLFVFFFR